SGEGLSNGGERYNGNTENHEGPATTGANSSSGIASDNNAATVIAQEQLLPLIHDDLKKLADMIRIVPSFPRSGIDFRHVVDIAQIPGGSGNCTCLGQDQCLSAAKQLTSSFRGAWALASQLGLLLVPIPEAGKLAPPVISVVKPSSHISSRANGVHDRRIEMERDVLSRGASGLVVDGVFASGETMCSVLELLSKRDIGMGEVSVMVVADFPVHRGRLLLRISGFGLVDVKSVLVFRVASSYDKLGKDLDGDGAVVSKEISRQRVCF
ncbi:unnamed protein product, partial [Colletotrichum noveboracense]